MNKKVMITQQALTNVNFLPSAFLSLPLHISKILQQSNEMCNFGKCFETNVRDYNHFYPNQTMRRSRIQNISS